MSNENQTCLGRGGQDGPNRDKICLFKFGDICHLDAGIGQFFHALSSRDRVVDANTKLKHVKETEKGGREGGSEAGRKRGR